MARPIPGMGLSGPPALDFNPNSFIDAIGQIIAQSAEIGKSFRPDIFQEFPGQEIQALGNRLIQDLGNPAESGHIIF
jgi:hypothetical protein